MFLGGRLGVLVAMGAVAFFRDFHFHIYWRSVNVLFFSANLVLSSLCEIFSSHHFSHLVKSYENKQNRGTLFRTVARRGTWSKRRDRQIGWGTQRRRRGVGWFIGWDGRDGLQGEAARFISSQFHNNMICNCCL